MNSLEAEILKDVELAYLLIEGQGFVLAHWVGMTRKSAAECLTKLGSLHRQLRPRVIYPETPSGRYQIRYPVQTDRFADTLAWVGVVVRGAGVYDVGCCTISSEQRSLVQLMNQSSEATSQGVDVVSFVDEAGYRGYVRKLTPAGDHHVGLLCALPIPSEYVDYVREELRPLYDRFCAAAPAGAKLHITDAFKKGNEAWRQVAEQVRDEIFGLMRLRQLRVVYAARRLQLAREAHERIDQIRITAASDRAARGPAQYSVPGANRPSDEQVDDQIMVDLSLLVDAFMENAGRGVSDFYFDQIDNAVADRYKEMIERTRNISYHKREVTARNLATGQDETRVIEMRAQADFRLDTAHLGNIIVAGKADPLVFAADVTANSLWRHLSQLAAGAPLNEGSSVQGWALEPITFYNRNADPAPSMMDLI